MMAGDGDRGDGDGDGDGDMDGDFAPGCFIPFKMRLLRF